jgi:hypothetical protein
LLPRTIDLFEKKRLVLHGRCVTIRPGDSWYESQGLPDVLYSYGF